MNVLVDATAEKTLWPGDALPRKTMLEGYRIAAVLGRGAFGITYRADRSGQNVAIKEFFPHRFAVRRAGTVLPADDAVRDRFTGCLDRFVREAQALSLFCRQTGASAGVVRAINHFAANGTAYLVMEYLEGETLERRLASCPAGLPEPDLLYILGKLAPALGRLHAGGLLHRDIRPAHIFLRDGRDPVLIGFGAVRSSQREQSDAFPDMFLEPWLAIEQVRGLRQGSFSDIYALAVTMHAAISGRAFDTACSLAVTRQAAMQRRQPDPLRPAAEIGAGRYPERVLHGIDAALQLAPELRPQDGSSWSDRLGLGLGLVGDLPAASGTALPAVQASRRSSLAAVAVGTAAMAALAGGGVYWLKRPHEPAPVLTQGSVAPTTPAPAQPTSPAPPAPDAKVTAADAAFNGGNYAAAIAGYREAADGGNAHAQYQLGWIYQYGLGVETDYPTALDWYQRAAAQNDAAAQSQIGYLYRSGKAGVRDYDKALWWYHQAAAQHFATAEYELGSMAQHGLGMQRDFKAMLQWYRLAAQHGSAKAQNELGYCYQMGLGVKSDLPEAARWYRLAAEQNLPAGMLSLGQMYISGFGVSADPDAGRDWIRRAASAGNTDARTWLATH